MDEIVVGDCKLYQNYPNPFNNHTSIKFDLPEQMEVKLTVYDFVGREIITLADRKFAAGVHEINWFPNDLSSGKYFYRFFTNSHVDVKSMIVIQ